MKTKVLNLSLTYFCYVKLSEACVSHLFVVMVSFVFRKHAVSGETVLWRAFF